MSIKRPISQASTGKPIRPTLNAHTHTQYWIFPSCHQHTSSRSSFIRSSKSYSFCFSSIFFLLISNLFFTWSRDERSTRMDIPRFLWSGRKKQTTILLVWCQIAFHPSILHCFPAEVGDTACRLTFLSIDVIQEVDGVFYDTVTHVAVVPVEREQNVGG